MRRERRVASSPLSKHPSLCKANPRSFALRYYPETATYRPIMVTIIMFGGHSYSIYRWRVHLQTEKETKTPAFTISSGSGGP